MSTLSLITSSSDKEWFSSELDLANQVFQTHDVTGSSEVVSYLNNPEKLIEDKNTLFKIAKDSQVPTFGWPIGVIIESSDRGFRTQRKNYGLHQEVAIDDPEDKVIDYWSLTSNGSFYLKQSLFEDTRTENDIFFDTRIIRVTETYMYLLNLYRGFGYDDSTQLTLIFNHYGIKGRKLSKASPTRVLSLERVADDNPLPVRIEVNLGQIDHEMTTFVKRILLPMFSLFSPSFELSEAVLEQIVNDYRNGKIS